MMMMMMDENDDAKDSVCETRQDMRDKTTTTGTVTPENLKKKTVLCMCR